MDSFHERMGADGHFAGAKGGGVPSRTWVRLIGDTGKHNGEQNASGSSAGTQSGPAFTHRTAALQLGAELYRDGQRGDNLQMAGAYVAVGRSTGDVSHTSRAKAGTLGLDVASLGAYWTWVGDKGQYVDLVAQGNHYDMSATSTRMPAVRSSGKGYEFSIEGGWPVVTNGAWSLEPQLQLRRLSADLGSGSDLAGHVNYGDVDSLVGRAGLKLQYKQKDITSWARLDLYNEFRGRSATSVSALNGLNGVSFDSSVHGRSAGITTGLDFRVSSTVSVYGSAHYRRSTGNALGHTWGGQVGVKIGW